MTYQVVTDPATVREVLRRAADSPPTNALTAFVPLEARLVIQTAARHLDAVRLVGPAPDWLRLLSFHALRTVTVTRAEPTAS